MSLNAKLRRGALYAVITEGDGCCTPTIPLDIASICIISGPPDDNVNVTLVVSAKSKLCTVSEREPFASTETLGSTNSTVAALEVTPVTVKPPKLFEIKSKPAYAPIREPSSYTSIIADDAAERSIMLATDVSIVILPSVDCKTLYAVLVKGPP